MINLKLLQTSVKVQSLQASQLSLPSLEAGVRACQVLYLPKWHLETYFSVINYSSGYLFVRYVQVLPHCSLLINIFWSHQNFNLWCSFCNHYLNFSSNQITFLGLTSHERINLLVQRKSSKHPVSLRRTPYKWVLIIEWFKHIISAVLICFTAS